jgi:rhamnosyltransferase
MNNVCIFALFQINGIKDYVFHNLNYLKNQLNCEIIAVSNTEISTEDCIKLNPFCKKIIVRKNKGRDFGAFKEGILSNFEEIKQADNLILINDTILGSFVNFKEDFITFTKKDCDFWGILERGHKKPLKSFICSFFMVFKSQILKSDCFKRFWKFYFSTNIKDLICQLGEKN